VSLFSICNRSANRTASLGTSDLRTIKAMVATLKTMRRTEKSAVRIYVFMEVLAECRESPHLPLTLARSKGFVNQGGAARSPRRLAEESASERSDNERECVLTLRGWRISEHIMQLQRKELPNLLPGYCARYSSGNGS
jgi:hypothetical protein